MRAPLAILTAAVVVAGLGAGCTVSEEEATRDSRVPATEPTEPMIFDDGPPLQVEPPTTPTVSVDPTAPTSDLGTVPPDAPTTGTIQPLPPVDPGARLTFHPVAGPVVACTAAPGGPAPTTPDGTPDTTVPPDAGLVADRAGTACYRLGPATLDGTDLAEASVAQLIETPTEWTVEVVAEETSRAAFNALFDACFDGLDTCPATAGGNGAVAIVFDGVVVSAPQVAGVDLADAPFTISGGFTEAEAKELARALNG